LAKKYEIISAKAWIKNCKVIGKNERKKLPSHPWKTFDLEGGQVEFSRLLGTSYSFDVSSIEECVKLAKKYSVISSVEWAKKYKDIGKKEKKKLPSSPWKTFGLKGGQVEFSRLIDKNYDFDVSSIEECVLLASKYDITTAFSWAKKHKDIGKKEKKKLPSSPWKTFDLKGGQVEFSRLLGTSYSFDVSSIEECVEIAKKNKIFTGFNWVKNYKIIQQVEKKKLPCEPWNTFGLDGGITAFSSLLGTSYGFDVSSIEECISLAKKHSVLSADNWIKKYKLIEKKEKKKLPCEPWNTFGLEGGMVSFSRNLNCEEQVVNNNFVLSKIQKINKMGRTTSAKKMGKFFKDNPNEFFEYHKLRKENMDYWKEAPYEEIAKKITDSSDVIIDFGCGGNELKKEIPNNKVTSIDHVAFDESVIECDMSDISKFIKDKTHDIAVFSLSLWGTKKDKEYYLKEAYRVLKRKGIIYIAETVGEAELIEQKQKELENLLIQAGFDILGVTDIREKFMYITAIKMK